MRYFSVAEIAKKWDISERSVRNYCAQNRVDGAFIAGKTWKIPEAPLLQMGGNHSLIYYV